MGTKQVRLEADVYELIKDKKRADETFSEAIERLTSDWSITECGGERSQAEINRHRELLEDMDHESSEDVDEAVRQMAADIG